MLDYQSRYLAHQLRKKKVLESITDEHYSNRKFSGEVIPHDKIDKLVESIQRVPSSCDRHGVYAKVISSRDDKNLLSGFLVGGTGWIHRASHIILLFGDPKAYVENLFYMPYLDSGVVIHNLYLECANLKLKGCYANPQVRGDNILMFQHKFGHDIFCGAFGVGYEA